MRVAIWPRSEIFKEKGMHQTMHIMVQSVIRRRDRNARKKLHWRLSVMTAIVSSSHLASKTSLTHGQGSLVDDMKGQPWAPEEVPVAKELTAGKLHVRI